MRVFKAESGLILALVMLGAQALLMNLAAGVEAPPAPPDLSRFPDHVGDWTKLRDDPIAADVAAQLKADRTLSQTYIRQPSGDTAGLLVAWFQSQLRGDRQPHSPKVCLPGSGWEPRSAGELTLGTAAGPITVNRYLVASRNQRLVILYWYQTPRRVVAGEWAAKILLVADALRDRRTDVALVRVVVPVGANGEAAAVEAATAFAELTYPRLREYLPSGAF